MPFLLYQEVKSPYLYITAKEFSWCPSCRIWLSPDTASLEYGKKIRLWSRLPRDFNSWPKVDLSEYIFSAAGHTVSYSIFESTLPKEATGHIVVLKAGKPAPWHIRLASILCGNVSRRITRR